MSFVSLDVAFSLVFQYSDQWMVIFFLWGFNCELDDVLFYYER